MHCLNVFDSGEVTASTGQITLVVTGHWTPAGHKAIQARTGLQQAIQALNGHQQGHKVIKS